jgi:hypothetical protein
VKNVERKPTVLIAPVAIAQKVQENPLGALLVAGGIGFALALLLTRPPSRSRYLR